MMLNESSLRAGRLRHLRPEQVPHKPQERYPVNIHLDYERAGQAEIRMCVVLNAARGQTGWLDVSSEEFAAIPEVEVSELEWEAVQCVGTPTLAH